MTPDDPFIDAPCRRVGGELWFRPEEGDEPLGRTRDSDQQAAVRICMTQCPVRLECLAVALKFENFVGPKSRHGVWGGLTPRQRAALGPTPDRAKSRRAAHCPHPSLQRGVDRHFGEDLCLPCAAYVRRRTDQIDQERNTA